MANNFVDHYAVLGLQSGRAGTALLPKDIDRAYKLKALELHPDKRPDDPTATASFQSLVSSYEVLKDPTTRKAFDSLLQSREDSKRRKREAEEEENEWRRNNRGRSFGDGNKEQVKWCSSGSVCYVWWNKEGHCDGRRLRELFGRFGEVKLLFTLKLSAYIVMDSRDAVVAAANFAFGAPSTVN